MYSYRSAQLTLPDGAKLKMDQFQDLVDLADMSKLFSAVARGIILGVSYSHNPFSHGPYCPYPLVALVGTLES